MAQPMTWIALGYRLAALPSRNRVYVWRKLKDFGAVYFESGVALLPQRPAVAERLEKLRADILRFGGHATLASMQFLRREDDQSLVRRFDESVREEYAQVEQAFCGLADTVRAAQEGRCTALCGDVLLASLRRAAKLQEKIRERDYFESAAGRAAGERYREAAELIDAYLAQSPAGARRGSRPVAGT